MSDEQKSLRNRYKGIQQRCYYPSDKRYKHYSGKGIKCLWKTYQEFEKDMLPSFTAHRQANRTTLLDRIDNKGDYCKQNCRWVTIKESNLNRTIAALGSRCYMCDKLQPYKDRGMGKRTISREL